ncbi:MAG: hypothetical protein KGS72_07550 [Cyanobacteria bacterium REEB67]|nr:hypothetical protein [Cyanobacteria bacterium REEB67]
MAGLALTANLLHIPSSPAAPAAHSTAPALEKTLVLRQYSLLNGKTTLKLTRQAVRLEIPFRRVSLILCAPDWDVLFLNDQSKIYCHCPAATWRTPIASGAALFRPGDPCNLKTVGSESAELKGLTCKKYILQLPAAANEKGLHTWQRLTVNSGELYVFEGKKYLPRVCTVISRTLGTLPASGIPLSLTVTNNNGSHSEEVKLEEQNEVPFKASDFQVPKNYQQVTGPNEVVHSDAMNEGLSELLH